jgi:hypothetical protein
MSSDRAQPEGKVSLAKMIKWGGIVFVLLPFVVFLIWRGTVAVDINRLRQKSIDRSEPQTPAEIGEWLPHVKPGDNAAEAIVDIWEEEEGNYWNEWRTTGRVQSKPKNTPGDPDVPFVGQTDNGAIPWPAKEMAAARAFVESRREHSRKLKAALALPAARFPIHYAEGLMVMLPHLNKVKSEIGPLQVENRLAIQDNRVEDSIDALDQMARLSGTLKDEPFLISQLVRIACGFVTFTEVEQLIEWRPLTAEQLDRLTLIVTSMDLGDALYRSLLVDRAGGLDVFAKGYGQLDEVGDLSPLIGRGVVGSVGRSLAKISGLLSLDQRLMLGTFDKALVLSTNMTPAHEQEIVQTVDAAVAEARSFPPKIFTGLVVSSFGTISHKFMNAEANRRLWLTALAVESYRTKHGGKLPASLDDLHLAEPVGAILKPFDGKTITLQVQTNGYKLRTVDTERITVAIPLPIGGNDFSVNIIHHYEVADAP